MTYGVSTWAQGARRLGGRRGGPFSTAVAFAKSRYLVGTSLNKKFREHFDDKSTLGKPSYRSQIHMPG